MTVPDLTVTDVLVPLDGSAAAEAALPFATALAHRFDAMVHLLTVGSDVGLSYLNTVVRTRVRAPSTVDIADGHQATVIAGRAGPQTLVCMSTHARGRLEQAVFGSVAHEVLRRTGRPALLIGPHADPVAWPTTRIVVPLDGSELAQQAVEVAAEWAVALSVPVHVVTVGEPTEPHEYTADVVESGHVASTVHQLERRGIVATWEVLHGPDPAAAVVRYADAERGTLIVMSTHGRTGLQAVTAGSVTTHVVHTARSPVLVLRPGDRRSAEIPSQVARAT